MSNVSHRDFGYLINILDAIECIMEYTNKYNHADDFNEDRICFDATMMNFIVIGEMAEKLSDELKDLTKSKIDWFKIKGFRNIIAHNYFGIDAEEVWEIIKDHLPKLQKDIKLIVEN